LSLNHRRDIRTVDEFKQDLLYASRAEREIIQRFGLFYWQVTGMRLDIRDNGIDNSGKLLNKVDSRADFLINGEHLMEVKYNKKHLPYFHLKEWQLNSYIKQQCHILWVNNWEGRPEFTTIKNVDLSRIKETAEKLTLWQWGNKPVYRLYYDDFKWYILPELNKEVC
jgi:hypothetical protein